jgi:hypothetical protein
MSLVQSIEGKSQGDRVVSTKIPREEFTRFQHYCKVNGQTINASLKRLIMSEIDNPDPVRIAGKSVFEYNKTKDSFTWKVILDDNRIFQIDDNLPASSIEQLSESLSRATEVRNSFIRKHKNASVPIPFKVFRGRK